MPTLFFPRTLPSGSLLPTANHPESNSTTPNRGNAAKLRRQISSMFNGSSVIQPRASSDSPAPKTPRPRLGVQVLSPPREPTPMLRTNTGRIRRSQSSTWSIIDSSSLQGHNIRPLTPSAFENREHTANEPQPAPPPRARTFPSRDQRAPRSGAAPEELILVSIAGNRRERKKKARGPRARHCTLGSIKNPKVRSKTISCLISGGLLAIVLVIYLALAISNPTAGQEFHILLILIILTITIFFCHSLVRLCMLVLRPERERQRARISASHVGPRGYADPEQPIPITLVRDEEIASDDNNENGEKPVLPPPPAYGLWRSSVRMNPNLVYWQKVEAAQRQSRIVERRSESGDVTANRPPSYVSDDGVGYVIEAQPRSTVPDRLPMHPSERGRMNSFPLR